MCTKVPFALCVYLFSFCLCVCFFRFLFFYSTEKGCTASVREVTKATISLIFSAYSQDRPFACAIHNVQCLCHCRNRIIYNDSKGLTAFVFKSPHILCKFAQDECVRLHNWHIVRFISKQTRAVGWVYLWLCIADDDLFVSEEKKAYFVAQFVVNDVC
jgi:hypothetical protein